MLSEKHCKLPQQIALPIGSLQERRDAGLSSLDGQPEVSGKEVDGTDNYSHQVTIHCKYLDGITTVNCLRRQQNEEIDYRL